MVEKFTTCVKIIIIVGIYTKLKFNNVFRNSASQQLLPQVKMGWFANSIFIACAAELGGADRVWSFVLILRTKSKIAISCMLACSDDQWEKTCLASGEDRLGTPRLQGE